MIATRNDADRLLQPYGPRVSSMELVEALNRWYHEHEVASYDGQHDEINEQLPPLWSDMLQVASTLLGRNEKNRRPLRILDFGCGTGFESIQILNCLPHDRIQELWCYDLSPEMLSRCRSRIEHQFPRARFTSSLRDITTADKPFDLLTTNSVMHHLPSPAETLDLLLPMLNSQAVWIAGHEPSSRYYRNACCFDVFQRYLRWYRRLRWLNPNAYWGFIQRKLGVLTSPADAAADEAVRAGLVQSRPPSRVVSRLVDLHVAHSREEAEAGRGFDLEQLSVGLSQHWTLAWSQSYSFMGPFYERDLPDHWKRHATRLATQFPQDGANFCAVWQRK